MYFYTNGWLSGGSTMEISVKLTILFFFQQTSLYVLVDHVPKCFGASATVNPPKMGPNGGNTRTFIIFSEDLLFLL